MTRKVLERTVSQEILEERYPSYTRKKSFTRAPVGYKKNKENPLLVEPDVFVISFLEEGFDYLDSGNFSYRQVAQWLTEKTGETISHQSVMNLWKKHRIPFLKHPSPRMRKIENYKHQEARTSGSVGQKIGDLKRSLRNKEKAIERLEKKRKKSEPVELDYSALTGESEERTEVKQNIVFEPNPGPQQEFLSSSETQVLYGGAAGGGKSYALLADPLRYFHNPNFNGLLVRRTNDELRELKWKSHDLYTKAFPGARFSTKENEWKFPSGARLWMTYLERDEDVMRYQGQAFTWIGFDELTQYSTPFAWDYLSSRLRTTDPELKDHLSMRATSNPGGPGHGWVKRMFVDPAPPGEAFDARSMETGEVLVYPQGHAKAGQPLFQRKFIPASLYDNPYLVDGGQYEASLLALPENERRKLLEGDWSVTDGAAFGEFRPQIHTCKPFEIPSDWKKFRSCDYGYSTFSAVHWFAIDPAYETLYVYRELYLTKHTASMLARAVLEAERGEHITYGVLDSSTWHTRGQTGPTIAEEMISLGCRWRPSDRSQGSRVNGKNRLHELLMVDEELGRPGIIFFDTCRQIIADLPVIPADPKGTDDIDPRYASDHAYDSIRYGIMSRPRGNDILDWGTGPTTSFVPQDRMFGY